VAITFGVETFPVVHVLVVIFVKDALVAERLVVLTEDAHTFVFKITFAYRLELPVKSL
jgi:hypothetical protein